MDNGVYSLQLSPKGMGKNMAKNLKSLANRVSNGIICPILGKMTKAGFCLKWAESKAQINPFDEWVLKYTIFPGTPAWERLAQVVSSFNREDIHDIASYSNWRALKCALDSGEYSGIYASAREAVYQIDYSLIREGVVKDTTPSWNEMESHAMRLHKEELLALKANNYGNDWRNYNRYTMTVITAWERE